MADVKLSLADQALANAIFCIAGAPIDFGQDDNDEMFVAIIKEVIGRANHDHPLVAPLIAAGEDILDAYRNKQPGYHNRAFQEARRATRRFAMWRLGQAMDRLRERRAA